MAGLERHAELPDFVRKPCDSHCRMSQHARGQPGLLYFRIPIHHSASPSKVDFSGTDWASAGHNARGGSVICDSVEDLAGVLDTRIDDFDGRNNVFRCLKYSQEPYT